MSAQSRALRTAVTVTRQSVATRGRLLTGLTLGAIIVLLAVTIAVQGEGRQATAGVLVSAGLVFQMPIITLVFAASAFGDFTEDETLVYLWLRPLPRWHLTMAAAGATLVVAVPVTAVPLAAAAAIGRGADLIGPAVLASTLGAAAYGTIFVALGLRAKRALTWGLIYVLIWEGVLGGVSASFARLSIRRYVVAIFSESSGITWGYPTSTIHALVVLTLVSLAGLGICTWFLRTREIE